jgi:hypothetical protein
LQSLVDELFGESRRAHTLDPASAVALGAAYASGQMDWGEAAPPAAARAYGAEAVAAAADLETRMQAQDDSW